MPAGRYWPALSSIYAARSLRHADDAADKPFRAARQSFRHVPRRRRVMPRCRSTTRRRAAMPPPPGRDDAHRRLRSMPTTSRFNRATFHTRRWSATPPRQVRHASTLLRQPGRRWPSRHYRPPRGHRCRRHASRPRFSFRFFHMAPTDKGAPPRKAPRHISASTGRPGHAMRSLFRRSRYRAGRLLRYH